MNFENWNHFLKETLGDRYKVVEGKRYVIRDQRQNGRDTGQERER